MKMRWQKMRLQKMSWQKMKIFNPINARVITPCGAEGDVDGVKRNENLLKSKMKNPSIYLAIK